MELERVLYGNDDYLSTILLNLVNNLLKKFENRKYFDVNSNEEEYSFFINCLVLNSFNHSNDFSEKNKNLFLYKVNQCITKKNQEKTTTVEDGLTNSLKIFKRNIQFP